MRLITQYASVYCVDHTVRIVARDPQTDLLVHFHPFLSPTLPPPFPSAAQRESTDVYLPSRPTSNILACHVRSCTSNNFPLQLKDVEIEIREAEYNEEFLTGFWPKVEWKALVDTAKAVSRE